MDVSKLIGLAFLAEAFGQENNLKNKQAKSRYSHSFFGHKISLACVPLHHNRIASVNARIVGKAVNQGFASSSRVNHAHKRAKPISPLPIAMVVTNMPWF